MSSKEEEEEGRHTYFFVTPEDLASPSTVTLPEPEKPPGLILEDGSINWSCPCLGSMVAGPCGIQFREAFSCFHYSEAEPKGSNCMEAFSKMQECMQKYPKLYGTSENHDDDLFGIEENETVKNGKIEDGPKIAKNDHKEPVSDGKTNTEMAHSENKLKKQDK